MDRVNAVIKVLTQFLEAVNAITRWGMGESDATREERIDAVMKMATQLIKVLDVLVSQKK